MEMPRGKVSHPHLEMGAAIIANRNTKKQTDALLEFQIDNPSMSVPEHGIRTLEGSGHQRKNASERPPSTGIKCPDVRLAWGPARNNMARAQSAGSIGFFVRVRWA